MVVNVSGRIQPISSHTSYWEFNCLVKSQVKFTHVDSRILVCVRCIGVAQLWQPKAGQLGKNTPVDETLRNLIEEVSRYPDPSPERQKALNRFLIVVQNLPGIYKSSHVDYLEALNRTWEWVIRNLYQFEPSSTSVEKSLVTWINGYLRWRIRDLYISDSNYPKISTNQPIGNSEEDSRTLEDRLPDPKPCLSRLDDYIEAIQTAERQRLSQGILAEIKNDPDGKLIGCHPRNYPECHCQLLAIRLLVKEPPQRIADIAREFKANQQTLYSHWKKKCLPKLQDIGKTFGHQP
ncbi:hypothetical protein [Moorena sp. SIO3H5]|uniref:hypothetical protein n=1 Tax=Moorena sp. SIO3H5 TaxID=2607834 RepID=UPI0013B63CA5|nr:hypothetical protein [Moorena sp. SIO3H5]NEO70567.1 hypothetical protein [Moorena sp. SIO3H5]